MNKKLKINDVSIGKSFSIIHAPILTEKSTTLNQFNQYSFKVDLKSTALEIKQAIQNIFKVKVLKINTSIVRGKFKIFKGNSGYRKNYKKAVVTLKEGQTIDTSVEIK